MIPSPDPIFVIPPGCLFAMSFLTKDLDLYETSRKHENTTCVPQELLLFSSVLEFNIIRDHSRLLAAPFILAKNLG